MAVVTATAPRPETYTASVAVSNTQEGAAPGMQPLPLFPVATHKFIVLSLCTVGVYQLYWFYQNWKRIAAASPRENLSPFWRAFFAPIWGFSLFERIQGKAKAAGISAAWNGGALGFFYLVLNMTWRLPDPWWLISIGSFVPMIPVQRAAQRLNESRVGPNTEALNTSYGYLNVLTIVLGGMVLVLAILGALMPAAATPR